MTIDVVVVDDEPAVGRLLEGALSRKGIAVKRFEKASEALAYLQATDGRERPRVVFSDRDMPGMDGIAFFAEVGKIEGYNPICYLITGGGDDGRRAQLRDGIEASVIRKPFSPVYVIKEVMKHLGTDNARSNVNGQQENGL